MTIALADARAQIITRRQMPVAAAVTALRNRQMPRLYDALATLRSYNLSAKAAMILQEIAPHFLVQNNVSGADALVDKALDAINDIAPVYYESMQADLDASDGGVIFLYPEPVGFPMGWDDWDELITDIENSPSMALYAFATCLRLGQWEYFERAAVFLGWNCEYANIDVDRIDQMASELERSGLGCFANALRACWYVTGNVYFDWNPYDDDQAYEDFPPFIVEGVRWLMNEWQMAQPILNDLKQANEWFQREPGVAARVLACMTAGMEEVEPGAGSNQTLMEIWSENDDDEGDTG